MIAQQSVLDSGIFGNSRRQDLRGDPLKCLLASPSTGSREPAAWYFLILSVFRFFARRTKKRNTKGKKVPLCRALADLALLDQLPDLVERFGRADAQAGQCVQGRPAPALD